jgi:tetrahydromethanopterin S-methyltransferase subunit G
MPTPTIIETDLREVLAEMNRKLDTLSADMNRKLETISKDVNQVQIRLATVETKVDNLEKRLDKMEQQIEKVEGNQSKQIWALIGILFTAVVATSIRFVLTALPQS